jgi:FkbM family methyltransferase
MSSASWLFRHALAALGMLTLVAAALAAVVALARDTGPVLRLRHAAQSALRPWTSVETLEIQRVGEVKIFLNPDDRVMTPLIRMRGVHEANETHWFVRNVGPGDTVVDVGANVGYYTLLGSRLVGEEGRVYAFEPDPESFALLERNLRLNGCDNVVAEQKAVSNEPGHIQLYLAEQNRGDHRIFPASDEERTSVEVEAVTLDDYFADLGEVDFVKIDTQGAEAVILAGMKQLIGRSERLRMAVEFSPWHLREFGADPARLLADLEALGFRMYELGTGSAPIGTFRQVAAPRLLSRYDQPGKRFTNLFVVKGWPEASGP